MLNCGLHKCPQYCHNLVDHSKVTCTILVKSSCPQKHTITRRCHDKANATCRKCEAEARKKEERRQRDLKLEQDREAKQTAYANQLAEIQAEIELEKRRMKIDMEDQERQKVLAQYRQDLEDLRNSKKVTRNQGSGQHSASGSQNNPTDKKPANQHQGPSQSPSPIPVGATSASPGEDNRDDGPKTPWDQSDARDDWEYQKNFEGQDNEALDALMGMIGK